MKTVENIMAVIVLIFLAFMVFTIGHAMTKVMALSSRLRAGYEANYQLDILAKHCVHTGYGRGRSTEKVFVCEGGITMECGPEGFMEPIK